ncbi:hypothetical protein P280DRAFT_485620 [Massarina eburnea CBS 473.64]|uniref:CFEM domain-containing protein n=1 Tax=Massarina eburnea CBS 473.64 TaxID=1395130 RepID=A0A6A6RFZ1_9PLEO|nr:hypothetical protein P280DRAFT_485620 [Massarina eburnea CBS 473.64]
MKHLIASFLCLFCLLSCGQAQNSTALLQLAIKTLPQCALTCIISGVSKSTCELSDFYCIARNKDLNTEITICVQSSCSIRESLTTKNFTESAFGAPQRDHTHLVSYLGVIGGSFAILAVILRVSARLPFLGGIWGWDDWAILVAMIPLMPLTFLSIRLADYGLGRDIWTVPFDKITTILHIYYFDEMFYLSSLALTKCSILLFYLRIFPNQNFRRIVYATLAVCALYIPGFVIATIVQCMPIRYAWEHWDGEHNGKCFNVNMEGWMSAAINIVLDIIVICMPLRELSKLAMSRRRKAGIMLMFLGGGFVTVVSILRLKWMIQFANSTNVTWDYTPIGYWSTIEVHIGIIFACLPAIRALQYRMFPAQRGTTGYLYNPGPSYANSKGLSYATDSRRKSTFTHTDFLSSRSTDSHGIRSPPRTRHNKEFIQLEEVDFKLRDLDGSNHTHIETGDTSSDDRMLLPIQSTSELAQFPTPTYSKRAMVTPPPKRDLTHAISVRKDYSVTVEISPDQINVNPMKPSEEDRWGTKG